MAGIDLADGFDLNEITEELRKWHEWLDEHTMTIVMHPLDVTQEIQNAIDFCPLTELEESEFVVRGRMYFIKPWELSSANAR